jgi:PKD repeat protein
MNPMDAVYFTATLGSGLNAGVPVRYRWDFGDGSAYAAGSTPNAVHVYGAPGTYMARVEVTNAMGHKAVSAAIQVVIEAAYVNPAQTTIQAAEDTYINSWASNTAHGSRQTLWTGHLDSLRGLAKFDTASIRSDYPVVTATLYVYQTERRGGNASATLYGHRVTKAWSEDTATWNTPWDVAGAMPDNVDVTPDGQTTVNGTSGWYSLDVTEMVTMWVANPGSNMGLLLRETSSADLYDGWASSEYWDTTKAPYIVVNYLTP